jgi:hypothetical protein
MRATAYNLLFLVALFSLACNRSGPSVAQLQEKLETVTRQNQEILAANRTLRKDYQDALDEKEEDFSAYAEGIRTLNETSESIRKTMEAFAAYKREYRTVSRKKAPGTTFNEIPFGSQTLRSVTIKEVNDTHIHVLHNNGSARIPMNEAPENLQARYGFDPSLDIVLERASGTGTDWLLSAISAAEQYAATQVPDPSTTANATSTASTSTSAAGTPVAASQSNSGTYSSPVSYSSAYSSPYSLYSTEPTWKRFSRFTGSYWAPLQQRKRVVGTVNTFTSADCCY